MNKLTLIFLLVASPLVAQKTHKLKVDSLSLDQKKELAKIIDETFEIEHRFTLSVNENDILSSYDDWHKGSTYDLAFKKKTQDSIKKNPHSVRRFYDMGFYYEANRDPEMSLYYYNQCKELLMAGHETFTDSAGYYSYLALITAKTGGSNFLHHYDHAFSINPTDTLTVFYYPSTLIELGQCAKAIDILEEQLAGDSPLFKYIFLHYASAKIIYGYKRFYDEADGKKVKELSKVYYGECIDFASLEKYKDRFNSHKEWQLVYNSFKVLGMMTKFSLGDVVKNNKLDLPLTKQEQKELKSLQEYFRNLIKDDTHQNKFSAYKALAGINIFMGNHEKAREQFEAAIKAFPDSVSKFTNNLADAYNGLEALHFFKDQDGVKELLERRIKEQPIGMPDPVDYINLAKFYYKKEKFEEAVNSIKQAYVLDPRNFETNRFLCHLAYMNGELNLVDSYANDAVKYAGSNADQVSVLFMYGVYYTIAGQPDQAMEKFNFAAKHHPTGKCGVCDAIIDKYIEKIPE